MAGVIEIGGMATIITAVGGTAVAVLGMAGASVRWIFSRIDRYQDKIEARLSLVETQNESCHKRAMALMVFGQTTASALRRHVPDSPELARAEAYLHKAFHGDPYLPEEMTDLINDLDKASI